MHARRYLRPVASSLGLLASLAVFGVLLAGCEGEASVWVGEKTVQMSEIESTGAKQLIKAADQPEGSATLDCPGKTIEAKKGKTANCTLLVDDGSELDVLLTMTDNEGKFSVEVAETAGDAAS